MEPTRPSPADAPGVLRRRASWLLVAAAYLIVSPYFERLNNPNENVRVWATRAIVAHHVLNIDDLQREWGYVNDKAKNDRHVYSSKAPGVSFLGVPVLFAETGPALARDLLLVALALGTMLYPYGGMFVGHALAAAAAFGAFMLIDDPRVDAAR